VDVETLWSLFERTYLAPSAPGGYLVCTDHHIAESRPGVEMELHLVWQGKPVTRIGAGSGPVDATVQALDLGLRIDHFEERSVGAGADAQAWAVVETARSGMHGTRFGVGRHVDIATAGVHAVISAASRWLTTEPA
jgi:2-isopropylmalate synthase